MGRSENFAHIEYHGDFDVKEVAAATTIDSVIPDNATTADPTALYHVVADAASAVETERMVVEFEAVDTDETAGGGRRPTAWDDVIFRRDGESIPLSTSLEASRVGDHTVIFG